MSKINIENTVLSIILNIENAVLDKILLSFFILLSGAVKIEDKTRGHKEKRTVQ